VSRQLVSANEAASFILEAHRGNRPPGATLCGISGIDASGKGYVSNLIVEQLCAKGVHAVNLGVDGWLNLPHVRFNADNPAEHFYLHAIRFEEMFEQLVLPLRDNRSHQAVVDYTEETATAYRKQEYCFRNVDVIVLEGVFLLSRAYRHWFDVSIWVDCGFETALERALARGQEGLTSDETIRAYQTIYFPAQRIHFLRDDPRAAADAVFRNDSRLSSAPEPRPNNVLERKLPALSAKSRA